MSPSNDHSPPRLQSKDFVAAIDQGSSLTRCMIFSVATAEPVASFQQVIPSIYPKAGWHEQDPMTLLETVETCMDETVESFRAKGFQVANIKALGITNQRETTVVWDRRTGEPLHNAIVWNDTRGSELASSMKNAPMANIIPELTGMPWSSYPSLVKLVWLILHEKKVKDAYGEGNLSFGTVDSWLVFRLNGGVRRRRSTPGTFSVHVTDSTNASRTMMMNLSNLHWEQGVLKLFELDTSEHLHLPKIVASSHPMAYGRVRRGSFAGVPITACLADQSASLVGQGCFERGQAKNTYDKGSFLMCHVGTRPGKRHLEKGVIATVAYDFDQGGDIRLATYALEGSVAASGAAVDFVMSNLGFANDPRRIDELAASVPDNGGVAFVTGFSGLLCPYWDETCRGTVWGLTHDTRQGHIARATLEAACFQTDAAIEAIREASGLKIDSFAVDGDLADSDLCMQMQADLSGIPLKRPAMRSTVLLGAAFAAGLAVGCWSSTDELAALTESNTAHARWFDPDKSKKKYLTKAFNRWEKAVLMCEGWTLDLGAEGREKGEDEEDEEEEDEEEDDEEQREGDGSEKEEERSEEKEEEGGRGHEQDAEDEKRKKSESRSHEKDRRDKERQGSEEDENSEDSEENEDLDEEMPDVPGASPIA